jgi:hypothetical protein
MGRRLQEIAQEKAKSHERAPDFALSRAISRSLRHASAQKATLLRG